MAKIAAITGGASGIGRGTAKRLLDEGWTVVAVDVNRASLDGLRKDFAAYGDRLHLVTCDVTSAESVTEAFREIGRKFGRLNGLVCSAGLLRIGTLDSMSVEDFDTQGVSLPITLTPRDDGRRTGMVCSPLWTVEGGEWTPLVDELCP